MAGGEGEKHLTHLSRQTLSAVFCAACGLVSSRLVSRRGSAENSIAFPESSCSQNARPTIASDLSLLILLSRETPPAISLHAAPFTHEEPSLSHSFGAAASLARAPLPMPALKGPPLLLWRPLLATLLLATLLLATLQKSARRPM